MNIEIVKFDAKKHWIMLQVWWLEREFPAPPLELLPPRGWVIEADSTPVCAGFISFTDSGCAVICHLVSDPKIDRERRHQGLDYLISYLIEVARKFRFTAVFASAAESLPKLAQRFESHGLGLTDKNINCYGRFL